MTLDEINQLIEDNIVTGGQGTKASNHRQMLKTIFAGIKNEMQDTQQKGILGYGMFGSVASSPASDTIPNLTGGMWNGSLIIPNGRDQFKIASRNIERSNLNNFSTYNNMFLYEGDEPAFNVNVRATLVFGGTGTDDQVEISAWSLKDIEGTFDFWDIPEPHVIKGVSNGDEINVNFTQTIYPGDGRGIGLFMRNTDSADLTVTIPQIFVDIWALKDF